jgi:hypothetical protein
MRSSRIAAASAATLVAVALVGGAVPANATTDWQAGQCFSLTAEQLQEATVPDADPVTCAGPHNIQVFYSGDAPVGTTEELSAAAKAHCSVSQQWAAAGIPVKTTRTKPARAYWANPQLWYWISNTSDHLVCAIGLARIVKGENQALRLTKPIRKLMTVKAGSPYAACISGISVRRNSVPCKVTSKQTPLTVFKVVNLNSKFNKYPGDKALRALAGQECQSNGTWRAIYPQNPSVWKAGGDLMRCLERIS